MFPGVYIKKEICECAFQACSPAFVHSESRPGYLRGGRQIQNSRALPDFPMRSRRKVKLGRRTPPPDFHVVCRVRTHRHAGMRDIRNREQQLALRIVKLGNALIALLDEFRDLFHLRNDDVSRLLLFFEPCDFFAGFVALGFALLVFCDELATFFVECAERLKIQCGAAFGSHIRKKIEMLTKVT